MIDSHLTDQYVKVQDDLYVCPSSEGLVYMHNPSHGNPNPVCMADDRIRLMD